MLRPLKFNLKSSPKMIDTVGRSSDKQWGRIDSQDKFTASFPVIFTCMG